MNVRTNEWVSERTKDKNSHNPILQNRFSLKRHLMDHFPSEIYFFIFSLAWLARSEMKRKKNVFNLIVNKIEKDFIFEKTSRRATPSHTRQQQNNAIIAELNIFIFLF